MKAIVYFLNDTATDPASPIVYTVQLYCGLSHSFLFYSRCWGTRPLASSSLFLVRHCCQYV